MNSVFGFILGLWVVAAPAVAGSVLVFEDNFDAEAGGASILNYNSFANWSVTLGTVDLLGPSHGLLAGTGSYVDLDGSTLDAGVMETTSTFLLAPGMYELSFSLAGNRRNSSTDSVDVSLGGLYGETFAIPGTQALTSYTRTINVGSATGATIKFDHAGGDNVGILLDNVRLVLVPTPAAAALVPMVALGLLRRRR